MRETLQRGRVQNFIKRINNRKVMKMKSNFKKLVVAAAVAGASLASASANAACSDVSRHDLETYLKSVVSSKVAGGFNLNMWLTFVDETGKVCAVVTSGNEGSLASRSEWLGSRIISAQKANTANAFSLDGVSISTGDLYAAVQPGGSLFGLQESNPVNAEAAYAGNPNDYGRKDDPIVGQRIGGVNVFGGGLAVYKGGHKIGAFGVSGDTSCTDHATVWQVRHQLGLDATTPGGFEAINLTTKFVNLGDHPDCYNSVSGADVGITK